MINVSELLAQARASLQQTQNDLELRKAAAFTQSATSTSGLTSTEAKLVWRRLAASHTAVR